MERERISFRDPDGQLVQTAEKIFRAVRPQHAAHVENVLRSPLIVEWIKEGRFISSRSVAPSLKFSTQFESSFWLEHDRIAFPAFPYEWCPEMLHAAAQLTLDLNEKLIENGYGLKDATPENVLFEGSRPIFVDLLSIERRRPNEASWAPFSQFLRTFVTPLLANRHLGLPLSMIFLTHRDGLEPEQVYRMCTPLRRFMPPFLTLITIPTWLSSQKRKSKATQPARYETTDPGKALFIFQALNRHLRELLAKVAPRPERSSHWARYLHNPIEYSIEAFRKKEDFILKFVQQNKPGYCLDIGCNTGHFSRMAARLGSNVVAVDSDETAISHLYQEAQKEKANILPLVINIARPSPAIGWKNSECASFLERAENRFDALFCLAFVHHLLVTERIPLNEIVALLSSATKDFALVEYVDPKDPSFQRMLRGRENHHADLTPEIFENHFAAKFETAAVENLTDFRKLFLFRKKKSA